MNTMNLREHRTFAEGDLVWIEIIKNGYWKGCLRGRFMAYTKTGKCKIKHSGWDKPRIFNPDRITHRAG